jgi:hypothetical protein
MTVGLTREHPKATLTIGPIDGDLKNPYYGAGERDVCFILTPGAREMLLGMLGYVPGDKDAEIQSLRQQLAEARDLVCKAVMNAQQTIEYVTAAGVTITVEKAP